MSRLILFLMTGWLASCAAISSKLDRTVYRQPGVNERPAHERAELFSRADCYLISYDDIETGEFVELDRHGDLIEARENWRLVLLPGTHTVTVFYNHVDSRFNGEFETIYRGEPKTLTFEAQAGHRYELKGERGFVQEGAYYRWTATITDVTDTRNPREIISQR